MTKLGQFFTMFWEKSEKIFDFDSDALGNGMMSFLMIGGLFTLFGTGTDHAENATGHLIADWLFSIGITMVAFPLSMLGGFMIGFLFALVAEGIGWFTQWFTKGRASWDLYKAMFGADAEDGAVLGGFVAFFTSAVMTFVTLRYFPRTAIVVTVLIGLVLAGRYVFNFYLDTKEQLEGKVQEKNDE